MHALAHQVGCNLWQVVYLGHRGNGIAAKMRVHDDGLWIGVADDTYALMAHEVIQFVLKPRAEIVSLQTVNGAAEAALLVESYESGTLRAQMRVIVRPIEEVVNTIFYGNCSKKTTHTY